jgi:hypothetical protein
MKKKNYLIPILSIAFIGTAAFFIFKSLKIKKEKQKLGDKDKDKNVNQNVDTNTGATNQGVGVFYDVLKNIFVQKDNPVTEQPINEADKKKLAAKVLFSRAGTIIRKEPKSTSDKIITLQSNRTKLIRVFSPNIQTMLILPVAPVKEGNYTWVLVSGDGIFDGVRGWVRLDVVDL